MEVDKIVRALGEQYKDVAEVSIAWKVPEPTTEHSVFEHVKWHKCRRSLMRC